MGRWEGLEGGGVDFSALFPHGAFSLEALREGDPDVLGSGLRASEGNVEVGESTIIFNKSWGWWWCFGALGSDLSDSLVEVGDSVCHRRVRRDTSSVEILASETVARFALVGFFGIYELTERVVRLRVGWLGLRHPMS